MPQHHAICNQATEWSFVSAKTRRDPFHDIELDVLFQGPEGRTWRVPAFWAGDSEWRVRFAPPLTGSYTYRTICSDEADPDLHDVRGTLEAHPDKGANPLLRHGPLQISANRRYLEHRDGTPFFWLGDIWWLGLTKRLAWPDGFCQLAADRAAKGFSVILLTAGLPCDMAAFDPRSVNEAGFPWEPDYRRINPAFFDMADLRIRGLVRAGLTPCIVGAWSFYLDWMGIERMTQHWRYLIARWGAYPVIWCLGGTVPLPWYLDPDRETRMPALRQGWGEVARYIRRMDPYGHPLVTHTIPGVEPLTAEDEDLLDARALFTGIGRPDAFGRSLTTVQEALAREPHKPVIQIEGGFEGARAEVDTQRLAFWALTLSGMAGFTYGANGIWQANNPGDPFGPSPWGVAMGDTPWEVAAQYPGSTQLGIGKALLERYPWWAFTPHPEWVTPHADGENPTAPYAAGIPGQVRVIYLPRLFFPPPRGEGATVEELEPEVNYTARFMDPRTGQAHDLGLVTGSPRWTIPLPPTMGDWLVTLER